VTGGAGFVGSHIVDQLIENDLEVTVIDDLSTGSFDNIVAHQRRKNFHFVNGDIRNRETIEKVFPDVEVVFHEAAFVGVPQSVKAPLLTNDVNVNGTLNLLEAAVKYDVKCFIYASSAAVYGEQGAIPIREDAIPILDSPYAASKLAAESFTLAYCKTYRLSSTCLRYFNVYGPRQSGFYGAALTAFVDRLVKDKPPVIYGDGKQTRDFVNIKDVVDANILAMQKCCCGEVFNIASGSSRTINSFLKILQNTMNKNQIKPVHVSPRVSDIRQSCADISKAKRILGFSPKVTIQKGLSEFLEGDKRLSNQWRLQD
jgi:UDP-glucose 4-epimerase